METIKINKTVSWENDKFLWEQSLEAQEWYNENIEVLLSNDIAKEIKQDAVNRVGAQGEIPEVESDKKSIPVKSIDSFARPAKWEFVYEDKWNIVVQPVYNSHSFSWAREKVLVTINKN